MRGLKFGIAALMLSWSSAAFAAANPSLKAIEVGDNDERLELPLTLTKMDVDISQAGAFIQTDITAWFANPDAEGDEAEFLFTMPDGAVVNGYGLDIDGHLIDGVLTEKERAEKAYVDKVTQNIDPGIAELVSGNVYKTRVFPIEDGRIVKIRFATPLDQDFVLPLKSDTAVGEVTISVPFSETELTDNPAFSLGEDGRYSLTDAPLDAVLKIPAKFSSTSLTTHSSGRRFASIAVPHGARSDGFEPRSVRIYWDHSLSRGDDNLAAERGVLRDFLEQLQPAEIEVITAQDRVTNRETFLRSDYRAASTLIGRLDYDSGSDLKALLEATDAPADMCILVSDGRATVGGVDIKDPNCPVYTLSTGTDTNHSFLRRLTNRTGGQAVREASSRRAALQDLRRDPKARFAKSNLDDVQRISVGKHDIFIAPISRGDRYFEITLQDVRGKAQTVRETLRGIDSVSSDAPGAFWASGMAADMRANPSATYGDIVGFSRPFNLAGPESALIVLEDVDDYIQAGITPPKNYPSEEMEDYADDLKAFEDEKREAQESRLEDMIDLWEGHIEWWEVDYAARKRAELKKKAEAEIRQRQEMDAAEAGTVAPSPPPQPSGQSRYASSGASEEEDFIVVTGSRIRPTTDIAIREWTPDRPYLKALRGLDETAFEKAYAVQRKLYGDLPAFYLEVADLLDRARRTDRAASLVLGALELPSANSETQTIVAHRLMAYGQYDRAIELYEAAANSAVARPQPFHHLGTAYAERAKATGSRADYIKALENFDHIIRTVWDGDDDGIELVSLMDANAVINAMPKRLKRSVPLDKRLVRHLPVGLRIVLDWTSDNADMDLWVNEPSGEKVYYGNRLSEMGGQMSNDMTDGYGPEQYLLRRSPEGDYVISAKYYASDAYDPNGAVGVRARVYKNFGEPDQSIETLILEFTEGGKDVYEVGTITVTNPDKKAIK